MWIDRNTYDDLRLDAVKAKESARILAEQNKALLVSLDWLRVRVTQVETERAQLMYNYMGIKIPVMKIEAAPVKEIGTNPDDALTAIPTFADMGDAEAARQGLGWDDHGNLIQIPKKQ